jgi:hypothetical protein
MTLIFVGLESLLIEGILLTISYVFRFNRRTTQSVGKRFWRMVQQLAASAPITNARLAAQTIRPALVNLSLEICG